MAESEAQLELKKRARRRLVGAAALALAAVIVLPMVMDHEPKPLTQDIQIRIPSQDAPAALPSALAKPNTAAPAEKPAAESVEVVPALPPAVAEPVVPVPPPEPAAKPDAVTAPAPRSEVIPKPPSKPETHAERAAKVEAILSGAASDKPENPVGGEFVVQLGAFGDPNNARSVQTRVKAQGYNAYTEVIKGKGGNQTRVRAGPFETREAAMQAASKLKQSGLAGVVAAK